MRAAELLADLRHLPNRVAIAMDREGVGYREVAQATGLATSAVWNLVNGVGQGASGRHSPRLATVLAVLEWLDDVEARHRRRAANAGPAGA